MAQSPWGRPQAPWNRSACGATSHRARQGLGARGGGGVEDAAADDRDVVTGEADGIAAGAGYSQYYQGLVDESFFNSKNLTIASGGGQIDGNAVASAFASGRGDTSADALATNVGLANLSYLDRYGGALLIGSSASPFTASATAGSGSVLGPVAGTAPTSTLNATARVRGLEGSGTDVPAYSFYGQPNAVVEASAQIVGAESGNVQGTATADAKGIDSYLIKAVPFGNGDGSATISGDARARLSVPGALNAASDRVTLNGNAVGIDASLIYGAPTLNTTVTGKGLATTDVTGKTGIELEQL